MIDAWYWKLPDYPKAVYGACSVFSTEFGLFGAGGNDNKITGDVYNLSFDNIQSKSDWKWSKIGTMPGGRCYSSCVMIKSKDHKYKLMVVAGETMDREADNFGARGRSNKAGYFEMRGQTSVETDESETEFKALKIKCGFI